MPVHRVVGGVEIKHDLAGRCLVRREEEVDKQALDGGAVMANLVVARRSERRVLEPVERTLAGEWGAVLRLARSLPVRVASTGSWRS
jgi:hypothetical protein